MSPRVLAVLLALLIPLLAVAAGAVFIVNQGETAVITRQGRMLDREFAPGPHLKWPLVDAVGRYDGKLRSFAGTVEAGTQDDQSILADYAVWWRIDNVRTYHRATRGDGAKVADLLSALVSDGVAKAMTEQTLQQIISGDNSRLAELVSAAGGKAHEIGVRVLDLRVTRVALPDPALKNVYLRMQVERKGVASELRARGDEEAGTIRANADRERERILAEAYRKAEEARGEGDANAAAIYSAAYGRDPEFYSFYRSINVYQNVLDSKEDVLVLEPDGELLRYLNPPAGAAEKR